VILLVPQVADASGRAWSLYAVEFDSPDGRFQFYLYAISMEHAHLQVDAIRESARVSGQVVAEVGL
jgi:hypothetical protein